MQSGTKETTHKKIPSLTCLVTFFLYAKHVQLGGIKKNIKIYHKTGIMNRFKVTDLHSRGWQLLLSKNKNSNKVVVDGKKVIKEIQVHRASFSSSCQP